MSTVTIKVSQTGHIVGKTVGKRVTHVPQQLESACTNFVATLDDNKFNGGKHFAQQLLNKYGVDVTFDGQNTVMTFFINRAMEKCYVFIQEYSALTTITNH